LLVFYFVGEGGKKVERGVNLGPAGLSWVDIIIYTSTWLHSKPSSLT